MKSRKSSKTQKSRTSEEAQVAKLYRNIHQDKRIYRRWMAGAEATVSTGGGGLVALTTLANAAVINATPDFASVSALYTTYRCRAIRVAVFPLLTAPVYNGAAIQTQPPCIAVFPWVSNTVPTTFAQALDVTGLKLVSGYKQAVIMTSYQGDPDAHLWTGTGSAIGSNEQFGISCIGTNVASTAGSGVWRVVPMYLVEFRMVG